MNRYLRFLMDRDYRFVVLGNRGWFKDMLDDEYLRRRFKGVFGLELDLENPKTFNEKMQWLKINDRNPLYTRLVDKFEVKQWVSERIGEEYIIPTYGVYDSFDEIDFDKLPDSFVMKCTHDSGSVILCDNRRNLIYEQIKKRINA